MSLPKIIGVAGAKRSGKDSIADHLVLHYGYEKIAFGDRLKSMTAHLLGLPIERMYHGDREAVLPEWGFSIRRALQVLGTEGGRTLHPDLWLNCVKQEIAQRADRSFVIPDVRFLNEATFVRENGVLIHVDRPGLVRDSHVSEAGVEPDPALDYIIYNDDSLDVLYKRVDALMKTICPYNSTT